MGRSFAIRPAPGVRYAHPAALGRGVRPDRCDPALPPGGTGTLWIRRADAKPKGILRIPGGGSPVNQQIRKMKLRALCTSKIHHATVTEANVAYVGSIGIDRSLMERADILPGEKVALWNVHSGARVETYALPAPRGSGAIIVNGAAARHFEVGDRIIIVAFTLTDEPVEPKMFLVDERNAFAGWLRISAEADAVEEELIGPAAEL